MDIWNQLMAGLCHRATPVNLLWALVGCALGTAVGVLARHRPCHVAVAMLLPITAKVERRRR
jgi:putative tricarboxylic transport membrane protein